MSRFRTRLHPSLPYQIRCNGLGTCCALALGVGEQSVELLGGERHRGGALGDLRQRVRRGLHSGAFISRALSEYPGEILSPGISRPAPKTPPRARLEPFGLANAGNEWHGNRGMSASSGGFVVAVAAEAAAVDGCAVSRLSPGHWHTSPNQSYGTPAATPLGEGWSTDGLPGWVPLSGSCSLTRSAAVFRDQPQRLRHRRLRLLRRHALDRSLHSVQRDRRCARNSPAAREPSSTPRTSRPSSRCSLTGQHTDRRCHGLTPAGIRSPGLVLGDPKCDRPRVLGSPNTRGADVLQRNGPARRAGRLYDLSRPTRRPAAIAELAHARRAGDVFSRGAGLPARRRARPRLPDRGGAVEEFQGRRLRLLARRLAHAPAWAASRSAAPGSGSPSAGCAPATHPRSPAAPPTCSRPTTRACSTPHVRRRCELA